MNILLSIKWNGFFGKTKNHPEMVLGGQTFLHGKCGGRGLNLGVEICVGDQSPSNIMVATPVV